MPTKKTKASRTRTPASKQARKQSEGTTRTRATASAKPGTVGLSRALREARENAQLSKTAAADKIGVHFVTLYAWENERRSDKPSDASLEKAARVYRTTTQALRRRADVLEQVAPPAAPAADAAPAPAAAKTPRKVGRPRKTTTATPKAGGAPSAKAGGRRGAAVAARLPEGPAGSVPRPVFARVLRILADLSDDFSLPQETLVAAQRAMTNPGLLEVFAAFSPNPPSTEDLMAAVDAAGVAVRSYVSARQSAPQAAAG